MLIYLIFCAGFVVWCIRHTNERRARNQREVDREAREVAATPRNQASMWPPPGPAGKDTP